MSKWQMTFIGKAKKFLPEFKSYTVPGVCNGLSQVRGLYVHEGKGGEFFDLYHKVIDGDYGDKKPQCEAFVRKVFAEQPVENLEQDIAVLNEYDIITDATTFAKMFTEIFKPNGIYTILFATPGYVGHAISLNVDSDGHYHIYNPNYDDGNEKVFTSEQRVNAAKEIYTCMRGRKTVNGNVHLNIQKLLFCGDSDYENFNKTFEDSRFILDRLLICLEKQTKYHSTLRELKGLVAQNIILEDKATGEKDIATMPYVECARRIMACNQILRESELLPQVHVESLADINRSFQELLKDKMSSAQLWRMLKEKKLIDFTKSDRCKSEEEMEDTYLHCLGYIDDDELIETIFEKNKKKIAKVNIYEQSALLAVAIRGNVKAVKRFLDNPIGLSPLDPVSPAVRRSHTEIARVLLESITPKPHENYPEIPDINCIICRVDSDPALVQTIFSKLGISFNEEYTDLSIHSMIFDLNIECLRLYVKYGIKFTEEHLKWFERTKELNIQTHKDLSLAFVKDNIRQPFVEDDGHEYELVFPIGNGRPIKCFKSLEEYENLSTSLLEEVGGVIKDNLSSDKSYKPRLNINRNKTNSSQKSKSNGNKNTSAIAAIKPAFSLMATLSLLYTTIGIATLLVTSSVGAPLLFTPLLPIATVATLVASSALLLASALLLRTTFQSKPTTGSKPTKTKKNPLNRLYKNGKSPKPKPPAHERKPAQAPLFQETKTTKSAPVAETSNTKSAASAR